mmetsp:Transcript_723/g.1647  ORF Transcript_723/g.1647 Transcript_723/m.1647 type:complete len:214 (-) Transcript_723:444-1085(-)
MRVGAHGILEEDASTNLSADHVGNEFGISSQRSGGTGRSIDNGSWCFVLEDLLEHGHGRVGTRQTELLEKILVGHDKFTHGLLHSVVGNQGEAAHVGSWKCRFEIGVHGVDGLFLLLLVKIIPGVEFVPKEVVKVQCHTAVHVVLFVFFVIHVFEDSIVLDTQHVADGINFLGDSLEHFVAVLLGCLDGIAEDQRHCQILVGGTVVSIGSQGT